MTPILASMWELLVAPRMSLVYSIGLSDDSSQCGRSSHEVVFPIGHGRKIHLMVNEFAQVPVLKESEGPRICSRTQGHDLPLVTLGTGQESAN